jgi:Trypsin
LTTYGFGDIADGGPGSPVLKMLETFYTPKNSTKYVLAVKSSDTTGTCQGDSGGPLVLNGKLVVGVNSFGPGACAVGDFDGFARVSTSYDWIRDTVCELSDSSGDYFNCCNAARSWYDLRQGVAAGVDVVSEAMGLDVRAELGGLAGSLGFSDNEGN